MFGCSGSYGSYGLRLQTPKARSLGLRVCLGFRDELRLGLGCEWWSLGRLGFRPLQVEGL